MGGGTGCGIEFFDDAGAFSEEADAFGIINGNRSGNILQGDMPDPLSRLVANIQARVRSSAMSGISGIDESRTDAKESGSRNSGGGGVDNGEGPGYGGRNCPNVQMEDCKRLYKSMRDIERECYELQKNINAWKRLNIGELVDLSSNSMQSFSEFSFNPSHCAHCGNAVTLQFLKLILSIFNLDRKDFHFPVSKKFVQCLIIEAKGMSLELLNLKRDSVLTLVTKSKIGASLILDELKLRLSATMDVTSAEILGSILEQKFDSADEYATLAMEILSRID